MNLLPRTRRLAAALVAVALMAVACTGSSGSDADGGSGDVQATGITARDGGGDPLPELELPLLMDTSTTVSSTDWQGMPTVVNFWATWCAFCVEEMPDIQAVFEELGDEVRFVGVDRSIADQDAIDFVEAAGVTYDLVKDTGPRADDFFFASEGRGMPTTLFVDADGVIQHRFAGPMSQQQLKDLIAEHLGV